MSPSERVWRVAVAAHIGLIGVVALREFSALSLLLAAILLPPLPGMLRRSSYTCAWASMLVAFYVAGHLAAGYARPDVRVGAFAVASLAALDYLSLMLFVRVRARERAAAPSARTAGSDDAAR